MDAQAERVAKNESLFRRVNEEIRRAAVDTASGIDDFAVVCECGHARCEETLIVLVETYERIRSDPLLFLCSPGHELPEFEDVMERGANYVVTKKKGEAKAIVLEDDPRA